MNCKPGDLAVVVDSDCGNEGKTLHVLGYLSTGLCECRDGRRFEDVLWRVDRALPDWGGDYHNSIFDHQIRPLLPPPGSVTDEEVRDLYAPKQTEAA